MSFTSFKPILSQEPKTQEPPGSWVRIHLRRIRKFCTGVAQTKRACGSPGYLVGVGGSLKLCMYYGLPGDADAGGLGTTPGLKRAYRTTMPLSHPNNPYSNFPACLSIFFLKMLWSRIQSRMIHYIWFSPLSNLHSSTTISWSFLFFHGPDIF